MGKRFGVMQGVSLFGVVGMLLAGAGCSGTAKRLQLENQQLLDNISRLQRENAELASMTSQYESELNRLENSRKELEAKLSGTGATARVKDGALSVLLPGSILFDPGKTQLRPQSKTTLKTIADILKSDVPNETVRIEGHTDSDPIKKHKDMYKSNWELSTARATTVLHFMIEECGLSPTRIYVAGFGQHQPIADNNTTAGKAKNRRVEFVILSRGSGG
ncbi:MAG: OmpA family protein [Candidatus Brocadiaceae bacterium]|nr:OmpA family protein [Candidatus Brocadiaceae bacterium]